MKLVLCIYYFCELSNLKEFIGVFMFYYPKGRDLEIFKELVASLSSGLNPGKEEPMTFCDRLASDLKKLQSIQTSSVPVQHVTI